MLILSFIYFQNLSRNILFFYFRCRNFLYIVLTNINDILKPFFIKLYYLFKVVKYKSIYLINLVMTSSAYKLALSFIAIANCYKISLDLNTVLSFGV